MTVRNAIYTSPNKSRIFELKMQGLSDKDIAEWINETEDREGEYRVTGKQVYTYLTSQLTTSSADKLLQMNRGKDLARFKAEADEHYKTFKRELTAAIATGDIKQLDVVAKHLDKWFNNSLLVNGVSSRDATVTINLGEREEIREKDALIAAVKEYLADKPGEWAWIKGRARDIMGGAMVQSHGFIDVTPLDSSDSEE